MLKRIFDFVFSLLAILVLLPFMAIIFLLVFFEFKVFPIYVQERLGKDGKKFDFYKFRTMPADSEKEGPVLSSEKDSRSSFFGRFLRKTFLDELIQLFNVFSGEMSIVGPRPERLFFHNKFCKEIPGWEKRLSAKPGMTGIAQLKGIGSLKPKEKLALDLSYIREHCLFLDLKIIFKTALLFIRKFFGGKPYA